MKIEISESFLKAYPNLDFYVVFAKGINNVTSKSRDIVLEMHKAAKEEESSAFLNEVDILQNSIRNRLLKKIKSGEKLPNINPFVNYFNTFVIQNEVFGIYADLKNIYGDLKLHPLKEEAPFLEREISFCKPGEFVIQDEHSITHRVVKSLLGKRVELQNESQNLVVVFGKEKSLKENEGENVQHSIEKFANIGKDNFGGTWEVYNVNETNGHIDLEYKPMDLDENFDVIGDLKKLIKNQAEVGKGIKKRRESSLGLVNKNTVLASLNDILINFFQEQYPELKLENRVILAPTRNTSFGHFSTNICFELSKLREEQIGTLTEQVSMKLNSETRVSSVFNKIEATKSGFINFFLKEDFLFDSLLKSVQDFKKFTSSDLGKNRVILIESPSANPNKPLHVGHLLNVFLGKSLQTIFEKIGFKVYNDNLINDKGMPICKAIWSIQKFAKDSSPEKEGLKPDHFVGKYYVLGNEKYKESKEVEEEVREILRKWENNDSEIIELWRKIVDWVLDGQKATLSRIDEEMGHMWFESDIYERGKETIQSAVDGKKIVKGEDGAIVAKLKEEYGVPDVVLVKSDGTSLYHTQDVYLTKLKIEKFNPWKAIWVVGNEQITHFQRLFSLIDMLGLLPIDNLYHLAYGYVFDKNGKKMSSRSGDALSGDELLDMIVNAAKKDNEETAEIVAISALKYAFLSSDPFKDMKFDIERALTFNGKSAPYIMYAYARCSNILKNVKDSEMKNEGEVSFTNLESEIVLKCLDYPNVIVSSANAYSPSILAEYLYDLAKLFSQMYETEKVLDSKGNEFVVRVSIVKLMRMILQDGLSLLRIKSLDRM